MLIEEKVDLFNTPGIYYALAYWISSMIFIYLRPWHKKGAAVIVRQLGILVVLSVFMTVSRDVPKGLFPLCVLLDFSLVALNIAFGLEVNMLQLWYISIRAFMVGELAAAFHWQLFYYVLTVPRLPLALWVNLMIQIPTWTLVFGITWYLEGQVVRSGRQPDLTPRLVGMLFFILFLTYIISNISYVLRDTPFTTSNAQELFIIRTLADLAGCGISYIFHLAICEMSARMEAEKMKQILEMQHESYRISSESMDLVNRKYHDLKHQIEFLKNSTSDEERRKYLDQMEEEVRVFESQNRTGNEVLDAILASKGLRCQEAGIEFHIVADGEAISFLKKTDISALFGNILDNAIEALQKVPEGERLLRLIVAGKQGFLKIAEENRCAEDLTIQDGFPVTTKTEEAGYHGFGVRSIRAITESYDGILEVETEDGWFTLNILIPIPQG